MKINKTAYPALIGSIIAGIIAVEGGYVNHPSDPGGETNYGITKKVAVQHGYTGSMKDMPESVAFDIYADSYIAKPRFDLVIEVSEPVGTKLVDMGVNVGQGRAAKWYQTALNSFSRGCVDYPCITADGAIGAKTITAHKNLINKRGSVMSCKLLLRGLDSLQGTHYMGLTSLATFNVGWFSNRISNIDEQLCEK